jgi:hypothetical protein
MAFLSDRIEALINQATPSDGTYQYKLYIDNELVFVGNYFAKSGEYKKLDITEIIKNFAQGEYPTFTETPTNSNLFKSVKVVATINGTDYETIVPVYMIYKQPFFNSKTDLPLFGHSVSDTKTMPMLQGFDYATNKALLLPTYPNVNPNSELTFDVIEIAQNAPLVHYFEVVYNDGYTAEKPSDYVEVSNGILQWNRNLYRIFSEEIYVDKSPVEISTFDTFKYTSNDFRIEKPTDSTIVIKGFDFGDSPDFPVAVEDFYGRRTVIPITNVMRSNNPEDYLQVIMVECHTMIEKSADELQNFKLLFRPGGGTTYYSIDFTNDNTDMMDGYELDIFIRYYVGGDTEITISTTFYERVNYTPCDVKEINLVTFSRINLHNRWKYKIANIDNKSRFFLRWRDRYGMPQMQPFSGVFKYGEEITKNTIMNYQNRKRVIDITNTSKWILNTGWIKQDLYPIYESIFVSPYLQLYDKNEDKIYNVILRNTEYEEKTFNNQNKQLFNLQLEVELDNHQYMVY